MAKGITGSIRRFVSRQAETLAQAPLMTPILPTPTGGQSLAEVGGTVTERIQRLGGRGGGGGAGAGGAGAATSPFENEGEMETYVRRGYGSHVYTDQNLAVLGHNDTRAFRDTPVNVMYEIVNNVRNAPGARGGEIDRLIDEMERQAGVDNEDDLANVEGANRDIAQEVADRFNAGDIVRNPVIYDEFGGGGGGNP